MARPAYGQRSECLWLEQYRGSGCGHAEVDGVAQKATTCHGGIAVYVSHVDKPSSSATLRIGCTS